MRPANLRSPRVFVPRFRAFARRSARASLRGLLILGLSISFVQPGSAQLGGMDGGGGGGKMVPGQDEDGDTLMRTFKDGVALLAEGECEVAEKKFEKVLKAVPRNSEANYLRGISLQCQQRYKQSIRYFQRAKRDDVEFFRAYGALGISFLAIERPDRARKEFGELRKYKAMCDRPGKRCPPDLLKAYAKLAKAIERAEGTVQAPAR